MVVLTMVVLTLATKIAGLSDYYRQFKDRYTLLKKLYAGTSDFWRETFQFWREKFRCRVFGVACGVSEGPDA